MDIGIWKWLAFGGFVFMMLAIDILVFHRKAHEIRHKEALAWTVVWIGLALVFNAVIYFWRGSETAFEFLTAYIIEKSLSVDNLFVFLIIFRYFGVRSEYQHNVLFWGMIGAIVFRGIFIGAGVAMIHRFHWLIYVFGAFLVYTGIKIAFKKDEQVHPENNPFIKAVRRVIPVSTDYDGQKLFTRKAGRLFATPLFIVLMMIETTDVIFAVDSVPAVLAISRDPFIVYTSNILAILGLRALYFVLAGMLDKFHFLSYGLSVILTFVGTKMLIEHYYKIPVHISLMVVVGVLVIAIVASTLFPKKAHAH